MQLFLMSINAQNLYLRKIGSCFIYKKNDAQVVYIFVFYGILGSLSVISAICALSQFHFKCNDSFFLMMGPDWGNLKHFWIKFN